MLSKEEKEILKILRDNSRISLSDIAKNLNIDIRNIFSIMNQFENRIITKYASLLDFEKIGFPIIVNYILSAINKTENKILKGFLYNHMHVNNLYKTEKGYIAELIFKDMKQFSEFNEILDKFKLKEKKFHPVIKEIKREGFLF